MDINEMSERKIKNLVSYVKGIRENLNGKELYEKYKEDIQMVTPNEAFKVFFTLLEEDVSPNEILTFLDKIINAFYKSLYNYQWEKPSHDKFLMDLINENEALIKKLDDVKLLVKESDLNNKKQTLLPKIEELLKFDDHYLKLENILFPYMEKTKPEFQGLAIMWELHDVVRNHIKQTIEILKSVESSEEEVNKGIANILFGMIGLKKKEELILYPAASESLSEDDWAEMYKQSLEYGFPFIHKNIKADEFNTNDFDIKDGVIKTETGLLSFEDIIMILNTLPLDITFVDENNKVKYFSKSSERIFPRSPAVIGRDVNMCHPPASVHVVEEIIESFREGKEDFAKFWIDVKGKKIFIQYFALRDNKGVYKGVLEVSQDITEIKGLEGERRLLKWENK